MIDNGYIINNEPFLIDEIEIIKNTLKQFYTMKPLVSNYEQGNYYYDSIVISASSFHQDQVLKPLGINFLSDAKPICFDYDENEDELLRIVEVCRSGENNCLLTLVDDFSIEKSKIKEHLNDEELHNVFNEDSLKTFLRLKKFPNMIKKNIELINEIELPQSAYGIKSVKFHDKLHDQLSAAPRYIIKKFIGIIVGILLSEKELSDYDYHGESETVRNDSKMRAQREVKFNGEKKEIFMHIKITQDWSIYLEQKKNILYVGKLTDHLTTKKY